MNDHQLEQLIASAERTESDSASSLSINVSRLEQLEQRRERIQVAGIVATSLLVLVVLIPAMNRSRPSHQQLATSQQNESTKVSRPRDGIEQLLRKSRELRNRAQQELAAIRRDRHHRETALEEPAMISLAFAIHLQDQGNTKAARQELELICEHFPESVGAMRAAKRLAKLPAVNRSPQLKTRSNEDV